MPLVYKLYGQHNLWYKVNMSELEYKNIDDLALKYDVLIFDMWGVITEGGDRYPGVVDLINKLSLSNNVFLASNSPMTRDFLTKGLNSWGLNITADKVFSSGQIAKELLAKEKKLKIFQLGMQNIVKSPDEEFTDDIKKADIVLITIMLNEDEDLTEFDELLMQIAELKLTTICANPDIIVPAPGYSKYGPGFFSAKIEEYGGKVIYTGKPHIEIYNAIFNTIYPLDKSKILMIGDTLETDIAGAIRAAIDSALVLTGNAYKFHHNYSSLEEKLKAIEQAAKRVGIIPTYVTNLTD